MNDHLERVAVVGVLWLTVESFLSAIELFVRSENNGKGGEWITRFRNTAGEHTLYLVINTHSNARQAQREKTHKGKPDDINARDKPKGEHTMETRKIE